MDVSVLLPKYALTASDSSDGGDNLALGRVTVKGEDNAGVALIDDGRHTHLAGDIKGLGHLGHEVQAEGEVWIRDAARAVDDEDQVHVATFCIKTAEKCRNILH